jgi:REP element-mobilizing transposase RayT
MNKREFNTDEPIAFFITWTTYGTWLPGDQRGWKRRGDAGIQPPNPTYESSARGKMKESAFVLSVADRKIVADTIGRHCEVRRWQLHAANPRSNHVHVVVSAANYSPDTVSEQFKAWCSRKLKPNYPRRDRFWTEKSSCRWINHEDDLESAIVYVLEAQDRKGVEE